MLVCDTQMHAHDQSSQERARGSIMIIPRNGPAQSAPRVIWKFSARHTERVSAHVRHRLTRSRGGGGQSDVFHVAQLGTHNSSSEAITTTVYPSQTRALTVFKCSEANKGEVDETDGFESPVDAFFVKGLGDERAERTTRRWAPAGVQLVC